MMLRLLSLVASALGLFMFTGCHIHTDEPAHTHVDVVRPADPVIVVPARGQAIPHRDPDGEIDD